MYVSSYHQQTRTTTVINISNDRPTYRCPTLASACVNVTHGVKKNRHDIKHKNVLE